jgi:hypothetical protein
LRTLHHFRCGLDGTPECRRREFGEFSLTSPTAPGVVRKWSRLQAYSDEVANARIYAGFHYRFSTEVGKDMGKKIGKLTVTTQLPGLEASADPKR